MVSSPELSSRILDLRRRLGLTQAQLAARLGVSRVSVNQWERGLAVPSRRHAAHLARLEAEGGTQQAARQHGRSSGAEPVPRPRFPLALTSFIGRTRELEEIARLLDSARLLTLTGMGGSGKTRLALEFAAKRASGYRDGVLFVELAPLADPALVPQAVSAALGLREQPGYSLLDLVRGALRQRHLLLVLDNCEHLVEACGDLAVALLLDCPRLTVLATSRVPLRVAGETVYRVPALDLPSETNGDSGIEERRGALQRGGGAGSPDLVGELLQSDAVRLFVERARLADPGFALTRATAGTVAQICRRLDGLPLAIELAATRVGVLSLEQIAARLQDRFGLLVAQDRTAPARHQTLRAAVDWSYDLLAPEEQTLFRHLSVFAGGFALEAVEAITNDERCSTGSGRAGAAGGGQGAVAQPPVPHPRSSEVLALLGRLIAASFVVTEEREGEARYRLPETLRQYGRELLAANEEEAVASRRHAVHYLELAERVAPGMLGAELSDAARTLEREHDNLRSALRWSAEQGASEISVRLATALWKFWYLRGHLAEARRWLDLAVAQREQVPLALRCNALQGAGAIAREQADFVAARQRFEESLALSRELEDRVGMAGALAALGEVSKDLGDLSAARDFAQRSLELYRELGNRMGVAAQLTNVGNIALAAHDHATARALYQQSLDLNRELDYEFGVGICLADLGSTAYDAGENEEAAMLFEEALASFRELDFKQGIAFALDRLGRVRRRQRDYGAARLLLLHGLSLRRELAALHGVAESLAGLAMLLADERRFRAAARLLGCGEALAGRLGITATQGDRLEWENTWATVHNRLGEERFRAELAIGQALSLDEAVGLATSDELDDGAPRSSIATAGAIRLSEREREVLRLMSGGLSGKEIASQLGLSVRTVERHTTNLYAKIGARSKADAIVYYLQHE